MNAPPFPSVSRLVPRLKSGVLPSTIQLKWVILTRDQALRTRMKTETETKTAPRKLAHRLAKPVRQALNLRAGRCVFPIANSNGCAVACCGAGEDGDCAWVGNARQNGEGVRLGCYVSVHRHGKFHHIVACLRNLLVLVPVCSYLF